MTMELPIFSELESAWFAPAPGGGPAGGAPARGGEAPQPGAWPPEPAGAPAASAWPGGSDAWQPPADSPWETRADDGWRAAQAASSPSDGGTTDHGLPRRVPMAQLVPGGVETPVGGSDRRTPDSVRGLLSAYHRGVQRGRDSHGHEDGDPYPSGKEQEA
jgi:hypothetical protein